jgi:pyrroloquinoline quinone biosynthesis protein D
MSTALGPDSRPRLAAFARLQHDRPRERWVVQAPERLFVLDEPGLAVLQLCDGQRSLQAIAEALAAEFEAEAAEVLVDIRELLQELADKGVIVDGG